MFRAKTYALAAGAMAAASAGTVAANYIPPDDPTLVTIPGTYSLINGEAPYTQPDPDASITGNTVNDVAHLVSRPLPNETPAQTSSNYVFTPTTPVVVSKLKSFSFHYDINTGGFGGGARADFYLDGPDPDNIYTSHNNGSDVILRATFIYVDSLYEFGGTPDSQAPTLNLITAPDAGTPMWEDVFGPGWPGNGSISWATAMSLVPYHQVVSVQIVNDTTNLDAFFSNMVLAVPEPAAAMSLVGLGGLVLAQRRRRRVQ